MNKIKKLSFLYIFFLSSCAGGDIYSELFKSINILISGPKDISSNKINSIPYSSIQVSLGRSPNILMILEEENQGILKWTSSNFVKIYTKNGFIIRLKGLENDLDNLELDKNHPIQTENFHQKHETYTSFYTFDKPKLFRLPVKTKINFIKEEKIRVLDEYVITKLYEEVSMKNLISWKFRNLYWVDLQGNIIKSKQSFTPRNPVITILYTYHYKKPE